MADPASSPERAAALTRYYFLRAGASAAWVAAAFTIGGANPLIGGALLVLYPAWDAVANARDALANGGLRANPVQTLSLGVSAVVALGVAVLMQVDMARVLQLFGVWAILAGLLQLLAGVRRWRTYGAQWAMILSGAQSALAGGFFIQRSFAPEVPPVLTTVAPYAAFGAFYFLVSAIALTIRNRRRKA
jgi:uncharacterized membrane protein HdeD (DUF308 family)